MNNILKLLGENIVPMAGCKPLSSIKRTSFTGWKLRKWNLDRLLKENLCSRQVYYKSKTYNYNLGVVLKNTEYFLIEIEASCKEASESDFKSLDDWLFTPLLENYTIIRTPTGGYNIYFKKPKGMILKKNLILPSEYTMQSIIKIKYGYEVGIVPPSNGYKLLNDPVYIKEAPKKLIDYLISKPSKQLKVDDDGSGFLNSRMLFRILSNIDPTKYKKKNSWMKVLYASISSTNGIGKEAFINWCLLGSYSSDNLEQLNNYWDNTDYTKIKLGADYLIDLIADPTIRDDIKMQILFRCEDNHPSDVAGIDVEVDIANSLVSYYEGSGKPLSLSNKHNERTLSYYCNERKHHKLIDDKSFQLVIQPLVLKYLKDYELKKEDLKRRGEIVKNDKFVSVQKRLIPITENVKARLLLTGKTFETSVFHKEDDDILFSMINGIICVSPNGNIKVKNHSSSYNINHTFNYNYNSEASLKCCGIFNMIKNIFPSSELAYYFIRVISYAFLPVRDRQVMVFNIGLSGTGKSQLMKTFINLFTKRLCTCTPIDLLQKDTSTLLDTLDYHICYDDEFDDTGKIKVSFIKKLSSDNVIRGRKSFKTSNEYENKTVFFINANKSPSTVMGYADRATTKRLIIFKFDNVADDGCSNYFINEFSKSFSHKDYEYMFSAIINNLKNIRINGSISLDKPKQIEDWVKEWSNDVDTCIDYANNYLIKKIGSNVCLNTVYWNYRAVTKGRGHHFLNKKEFERRLIDNGFTVSEGLKSHKRLIDNHILKNDLNNNDI